MWELAVDFQTHFCPQYVGLNGRVYVEREQYEAVAPGRAPGRRRCPQLLSGSQAAARVTEAQVSRLLFPLATASTTTLHHVITQWLALSV